MNKLSKEQADWLIENINNSTEKGCQLCDCDIPREEMIKIINQCTEKEFPVLNHPITRVDGAKVNYIKIEQAIHSSPWVVNMSMLDASFVGIRAEEFKVFTEGCNKIVEWLNENS